MWSNGSPTKAMFTQFPSTHNERMISVGHSCVMHFDSNASSQGWIYSVTVKTQAVLPAQTHLRGKILLSIHGENASLNDALLASSTFTQDVFHAGGEDLIELRNSTRLGEVNVIRAFPDIVTRSILSNYASMSPNGNRGCATRSRFSTRVPTGTSPRAQ